MVGRRSPADPFRCADSCSVATDETSRASSFRGTVAKTTTTLTTAGCCHCSTASKYIILLLFVLFSKATYHVNCTRNVYFHIFITDTRNTQTQSNNLWITQLHKIYFLRYSKTLEIKRHYLPQSNISKSHMSSSIFVIF